MSFKANFDFILHLESFRNIDLFQQGLYYLRFYISHEKNRQVIFAQPYNMIDGHSQKKEAQQQQSQPKNKLGNRGPWAQAQINDDSCSFQTQTFLIRYTEEEIELNDICFFKAEIDAYPSYDQEQFNITCELRCADLTSFGCSTKTGGKDNESMFKTVSVHQSKINNIAYGVHEYVNISFDSQHFCLAHASFHSTLLDFKFRLSDYQMEIMSRGSMPQQKQSSYQIRNNKENQRNMMPVLLQPQNFTEFLNKATKRFNKEEVNNFYDSYVNSLRDEYNEMKKFLQKLRNHAIPDRIQQQHKEIFNQQFENLDTPLYIEKLQKEKQNQQSMLEMSQQFNNVQIVKEAPLTQNNNFLNTLNTPYNQFQQTQQIQPKQQQQNIADLYQLHKCQDQENLAHEILQELNIISGHLFQVQKALIEYLKLAPFEIIQHLGINYHKKMKDMWGEYIFRNYLKTHDVTINTEPDAGKNHKYMSEKMRQQAHFKETEQFQIENIDLFPEPEKHPVLFEDIFTKNQNMSQQSIGFGMSKTKQPNVVQDKGYHVFILCHGFQGNSFDMRHFKNNLALIHPNALFLCAKAYEDFTDQDIGEMGRKLALEVKNYIKEWCPNGTLGRMSFVGHSLGGIIIRAALPHLTEFKHKMYTFLSLSSPHLGYMYNSSKVVDAGIWILQKMRKSKCLQQLSMSDHEDIRFTFLYNLARAEGLNWFENVGLVSSFQDSYVAFESARIQKFAQGTFDSEKGYRYQEMVDYLLGNIKSNKVHRIDVNFNIKDITLDNAIGRTAHILFLECDPLQKMFVYCFDHLFQ